MGSTMSKVNEAIEVDSDRVRTLEKNVSHFHFKKVRWKSRVLTSYPKTPIALNRSELFY